MSETHTRPDGKATEAPSSSAETPTPTPAPASGDRNVPSSGKTETSPSSGDSRQSDRDGLLAAVRKVVVTKPEARALPSEDTSEAEQDRTVTDAENAEPRTTETRDLVAAPGEADKDTSSPSPAEKEQTTQDRQVQETLDDLSAPDPSDAELKKLRPETRKRFERLLAQRNQARQQWDGVQGELEQHRQLQGYLKQHQLAPEDVNMLLGVGASLRRRDYAGFLQGVTPYVLAAQEALGLRVAQDLQRQVDDGTISEDTAKELTRTRHRAAQAEHQLNDHAQRNAAETQNRSVQIIRTAVDNWEANIRSRDPDYPHLADTVRRYAQGLMQERGIPQTPEQAVQLTQTAYDEAKKTMSKLRPSPQPTRQTPSGVHVATNGAANVQPRTMKEAVLAELQRMRRAS
jgi:hypothetical protein